MAFSSKDAGSGSARKLFTGLVNVNVVSVNPNATEKVSIYGGEPREEPVYTGKSNDGDNQIRIDFHLDSDVDGKNPETRIKTTVGFYVVDAHRLSATGKWQVTNKFGQFAWVEEDDIKKGTTPYSWFSTIGMRRAYKGEEELIGFIKSLANVPNLKQDMSNVADAEATFENIPNFFKGDVSEVKDVVSSTNNKVKVLLGVKTADDGKMYQAVYNRKFERSYSKTAEYMEKAIVESKENGAFANVEFGRAPYEFQEFNLEPSTKEELSSEKSPSDAGW